MKNLKNTKRYISEKKKKTVLALESFNLKY